MTAPLRTAGQFLAESGFGAPANPDAFPEYPDLDAQLSALRKLDPSAHEIPWIEYALGRAREARLADDAAQEQRELQIARLAIENSFKRRTPARDWPKVLIVLAIIAALAALAWLEVRRRRRLRERRRAQRLAYRYDPLEAEDELEVDDSDDGGVDGDDENEDD